MKLIQHEDDQLIDHPHIFWLLWSAKEAIFKCEREPKNFSPTSISVQLADKEEGISFTTERFDGKVIITDEYILAICSDQTNEVAFEVIEKDEKEAGGFIRIVIESFFQKQKLRLTVGVDELNLPIIMPYKEAISISHHGRFGAFAYPKSLINV